MAAGWEFGQYKDFVLFKAYADLRTEAERTYVGFAWWIVEPVLYMAIFYLVFAVVLGARTDNFIAFLLIGLTVWRWFQATIMSGSMSISQSRGIINQVYFPKMVLPTVSVLTNTVKFLVVFVLLLIFLIVLGYAPSVVWGAIPIMLGVLLVMILAFTYAMSALLPFLPDVRILIDNLLRGVFFMSGIFFDIGDVEEPMQGYLYLNPMAALIRDFRGVLIYQQWPEWNVLLFIFVCSIIVLVMSLLILRCLDRVYPRVVS